MTVPHSRIAATARLDGTSAARARGGSAWPAVTLLSPAVLFLVAFFVVPLAALFVFSFYKAGPGGLMISALSLDNYRKFLSDPFYLGILADTLRLGLDVTVWCVVLGFPLAYGLARTRHRQVRGALVVLLLVPLMTSVVVRSYGWTILLAGNGPVNGILLWLGVTRQPLQLLYTMKGTTIALVEVLLPFMVLSLVPVIQNIGEDLEHAAQSLGANGWRTFVDVVLPLSMPGVAGGSILVFSLAIAAYATPALVGGAKILVLSLYVYQQALTLFNWPFGAAISFILLALVLGLTVAQTRLMEHRVWDRR